MSQHIHGNVAQSVSNEYGEFITVFNLRLRKSLIMAYTLGGPRPDDALDGPGLYSINIMIAGGYSGTVPHTLEECEKEIARLDWIFEKDKRDA